MTRGKLKELSMRVVSLGSGSSGNAFFVEAGPQGRTRFIVDAGLGARTILQRLLTLEVVPSQLSAIFVTHEHSDHIQAIHMFMKYDAMPVIADPRTLEAVKHFVEKAIQADARRAEARNRASLNASLIAPSPDELSLSEAQQAQSEVNGSVPIENETTVQKAFETGDPQTVAASWPDDLNSLFVPFPVGSQRLFGDVEVASFATSHVAVAPCGYLLCADRYQVCIAIDTGTPTTQMLKAMRHADLLILEANYHRERLLSGPYPQSVKRRIMSPQGHLSNAQASRAVLKAWSLHSKRCLWLAHLSEINNTPQLVIDHMRTHLQSAGVDLSLMTIAALPSDMGIIWDSTSFYTTL